MPYPNEHAARVRNPEDFEPDSFRRKDIETEEGGVAIIVGKLRGEDGMTAQSYRFDAATWTAQAARRWLRENVQERILVFDEATGEEGGGEMEEEKAKTTKHGPGGGSGGYSGGRSGWRRDTARLFAGEAMTAIRGTIRRFHMIAARMGVTLPQLAAASAVVEKQAAGTRRLPESNWEEGRRTPMSEDDLKEAFWLAWATLAVKFEVENIPEGMPDWAMSAARAANKSVAAARIAIGDGVKALGDGRVAGYLVRFGSSDTPDLEGEYFDAETIYTRKSGDSIGLFWHHGLDGTIRSRHIGDGTLRMDDVGVWVEGQLKLRDDYERAIYSLVEQGKCGWSSGSVGRLVERDGKRIRQWILAEASITPTPAEYRNQVISAKTYNALAGEAVKTLRSKLSAGHEGDEARPGEVHDVNHIEVLQGEATMSDEKKVPEQPESAQDDGVKALDEKLTALSDRFDEVLQAMQASPAVRAAGYYSVDGASADPGVKSFGDFALAVARRDTKRLATVYGTRRVMFTDDGEAKDLGEQSGVAGGYLVPEGFEASLRQIAAMQIGVRNLVEVIPTNFAAGSWPGLDQQITPIAGVGDTAFAGGVTAAKRDENATLPYTEPQFNLIEWHVHKCGGYTNIGSELMEDSAIAIETLLRQIFATAIAAKEEYYVLRGSNTGEPLGILNSDAAIEVTSDASNVFKWVDVLEMHSHFKAHMGRWAWVVHPTVLPQIGQMEVGTAGAAAMVMDMQGQSPTGYKMLNIPVMVSEHLSQLGNDYAVLLADFSAYYFWQRRGLTIAMSEHAAFPDDQVVWRFTERLDGKPALSGPITLADPQVGATPFTVSPFVILKDKP